jgi:hypothetical protein
MQRSATTRPAVEAAKADDRPRAGQMRAGLLARTRRTAMDAPVHDQPQRRGAIGDPAAGQIGPVRV